MVVGPIRNFSNSPHAAWNHLPVVSCQSSKVFNSCHPRYDALQHLKDSTYVSYHGIVSRPSIKTGFAAVPRCLPRVAAILHLLTVMENKGSGKVVEYGGGENYRRPEAV